MWKAFTHSRGLVQLLPAEVLAPWLIPEVLAPSLIPEVLAPSLTLEADVDVKSQFGTYGMGTGILVSLSILGSGLNGTLDSSRMVGSLIIGTPFLVECRSDGVAKNLSLPVTLWVCMNPSLNMEANAIRLLITSSTFGGYTV